MRIALVIAAKDLRQRLRDRSALVVGVAAPLMLALIISAALGGTGFNSFHATYALYDGDHGSVARSFTAIFRTPQLRRAVRIRTVRSAAEAASLTKHDLAAAFVIPPGFSGSVTAGDPAAIRVIRSRADLIGGQVAVDIAGAFAARVEGSQLAVRSALAAGAPASHADALVARATIAPLVVTLDDTAAGGRQLKPASYFGPAMAIFFLFFTVGLGARSLLAERRQATLARLQAAPISARAVLGGKAIASFLLGFTSMLVLVVASSALLGARWGHPLAVLLLIVAAVLAAMGITTLVVTAAKTEEQAGGYSSAVGVVLALLGGNFIPISSAPAVLRRLTLLTPNGWALRGFTDLGTGARASAIVPSIVALGLFAAVTGGVAVARANRVVHAQ